MGLIPIIEGVARNLSNKVVGEGLVLIDDEQRFVTAVTESGAVHTFIVDVEHAAKDGEALIKWVEHTRALAAVTPPAERGGPTADEVKASADESIGASAPEPTGNEQHEGGAY